MHRVSDTSHGAWFRFTLNFAAIAYTNCGIITHSIGFVLNEFSLVLFTQDYL
jgi:hypothetical protein